MKISKTYEENFLVGSLDSKFRPLVKVGLTLHSEKDLKSTEEIKEYSSKLGELVKILVQAEIKKIKEEKSNQEEN
jgi:hypothetical protein